MTATPAAALTVWRSATDAGGWLTFDLSGRRRAATAASTSHPTGGGTKVDHDGSRVADSFAQVASNAFEQRASEPDDHEDGDRNREDEY